LECSYWQKQTSSVLVPTIRSVIKVAKRRYRSRCCSAVWRSKTNSSSGLIPIIEPEIWYFISPEKSAAEVLLKKRILKHFRPLFVKMITVCSKLPSKTGNFIISCGPSKITKNWSLYPGGYSRWWANQRFHKMKGMIASSRAHWPKGVSAQQSDAEFRPCFRCDDWKILSGLRS